MNTQLLPEQTQTQAVYLDKDKHRMLTWMNTDSNVETVTLR